MRREAERVLAALSRDHLLLKQDKHLPNVVTIVTGERLSTSWWSHPKGKLIFAVLRELEHHPDVLVAKLIAGKDTLIDRSLWPALLAVVNAREPWQRRHLRAHATEVHTESGRHAIVAQPWSAWAKERGVVPLPSAQEGRAVLERTCAAIGAPLSALPWRRARSPRRASSASRA